MRLMRRSLGSASRRRRPAFSSRSIRPPKYGLLRYLVDAIESGVADDMLLVLLWLDNSFHVATLDHDKDLISARTAAFIKSIAGR